MTLLFWLLLPLAVAWVIVVADVLGQPRLSRGTKARWLVLVTLFWPGLVLYWLSRPMQGRAERPMLRRDPRAQLVDVVLAHAEGRIDEAELEVRLQRLRTGAGG